MWWISPTWGENTQSSKSDQPSVTRTDVKKKKKQKENRVILRKHFFSHNNKFVCVLSWTTYMGNFIYHILPTLCKENEPAWADDDKMTLVFAYRDAVTAHSINNHQTDLLRNVSNITGYMSWMESTSKDSRLQSHTPACHNQKDYTRTVQL